MDFVLAGIAHQAACVFVAAAGRAQVSAAASAAGNGLGAWDDPLLGLDAHAQVVRERAQGGWQAQARAMWPCLLFRFGHA